MIQNPIATGGGSVTITISMNDVKESHIVYTDPEGNAQILPNPAPGQTFTALKGSACCVTVSGSREVGIRSQALTVSIILDQTASVPPTYIRVYLVTLSASGSIDLVSV